MTAAAALPDPADDPWANAPSAAPNPQDPWAPAATQRPHDPQHPHDLWAAAGYLPGPLAPYPDLRTVEGTVEESLLQAAFQAAEKARPADGSEPIGGPGSTCTLTGDQLSLLLAEVSTYWMTSNARALALDEAEQLLDDGVFTLFSLADSGSVHGFAHHYARLTAQVGAS